MGVSGIATKQLGHHGAAPVVLWLLQTVCAFVWARWTVCIDGSSHLHLLQAALAAVGPAGGSRIGSQLTIWNRGGGQECVAAAAARCVRQRSSAKAKRESWNGNANGNWNERLRRTCARQLLAAEC